MATRTAAKNDRSVIFPHNWFIVRHSRFHDKFTRSLMRKYTFLNQSHCAGLKQSMTAVTFLGQRASDALCRGFWRSASAPPCAICREDRRSNPI
jgi:hypothetical protein